MNTIVTVVTIADEVVKDLKVLRDENSKKTGTYLAGRYDKLIPQIIRFENRWYYDEVDDAAACAAYRRIVSALLAFGADLDFEQIEAVVELGQRLGIAEKQPLVSPFALARGHWYSIRYAHSLCRGDGAGILPDVHFTRRLDSAVQTIVEDFYQLDAESFFTASNRLYYMVHEQPIRLSDHEIGMIAATAARALILIDEAGRLESLKKNSSWRRFEVACQDLKLGRESVYADDLFLVSRVASKDDAPTWKEILQSFGITDDEDEGEGDDV